VLFSLEEIVGVMNAPVLGSVVLSSATSWMVLHLLLGDEPLFHVGSYQLIHPAEFGAYGVLGVVGGLGSVCFVKLLLWIRARFMRMPKSTVWLQPVAGGLGTGILGFFVPGVMGVGYDIVDKALHGNLILQTMVLLAVLKLVATALCYGSGNAGGIFGPSLFIGAMIGGAVGSVAHALFPAYTADPGAYALVGMGTAFAGIIRTPLTSVIMIFELTRDYSIIVPLMISNLIAFFISYKLQREPIYEALAHQDGVHLPSSGGRAPGRQVRVEQAMQPAPIVLHPDTLLVAAVERVNGSQMDAWPVADESGLLGMISKVKLEDAIAHGLADRRVADVLGESFPRHLPSAEEFPHLHLDHDLGLALERMGATKVNVLPVVSRANLRELLGVVTLEDVLRAYGVPQQTGGTG